MENRLVRYNLVKEEIQVLTQTIRTSKDAATLLKDLYTKEGVGTDIVESFFIMTLNRKNKVTGYKKISEGSRSGTIVDIPIVLKFAVDSLAHGIILAHNHPSGELSPSNQDKELTTKIINAGKFMDLNVLDHIILTENSYYSFADEGILS
jgi:DNA repair protein RadC